MTSDNIVKVDFPVWIIFGTLSLIGILGNGFIMAVNGLQWLQNRKIILCDFLLTSASTYRFIMQLTLLLYNIFYYIPENIHCIYRIDLLFFSWMFSNMISYWCATWLSVFYCVKVANFANPLFLWLKTRINMLVPRLLGLSIAVFTVSCLPSIVDYFGQTKWDNLTEILQENTSQRNICDIPHMTFLPIQLSFYVINLCLSTIAIILLLASLCKHRRNLKKSGVGVKDLSTQVHIKVMTFLLLWLFLYFLDFIGMIIYTNNTVKTIKLEGVLIDILMSAFSSAHPIILILTNPKLKEMSACIIKKMYARVINIRCSTL
ncbi:taste receptor type 2 member 41-like [Anolis carolinensis]|uniref:taste receptor type 2 member 41-like n=1 Tax=Anolis carolinensis TaxID=28377 RepID=UPI002F2B3725